MEHLRWSAVDARRGVVRLEPGTTKNDEGREFPFGSHPALATLLTEQRQAVADLERRTGREVPWVFPGPKGNRLAWYYDAWRLACRNAGLEGKLLHDLRRTAVRNLERAGVPRSVAMKLTGHKTESIYRRYAIVSESDLSEAVARVAKLHGTLPPRLRNPEKGDTGGQ